MQALDLRDNALQWETERQNRILQNAAEQKKRQARPEAVLLEQVSPARQESSAASRLNEWVDKVHAIPEMRSALIPLEDNEVGWSKPFSLAKANVEPWLSYYHGYRQSRLFLGGELLEVNIDFPVRALLELKRAHVRLIMEPPVQINGQVQYFDAEGALNDGLDPGQFRSLLREAVLTHEKQLKRAEQKGREMGDALYDALMGEGHANLINAWGKVYRRKPTVEELHQMLTSGRVRGVGERRAEASDVRHTMSDTAPVVATVRLPPVKRPEPTPREVLVQPKPVQPAIADEGDGDEAVVTLSSATQKSDQDRFHKFLWPAIHAAVACAAFVAYIFLF